jgi:uncharacterized protein
VSRIFWDSNLFIYLFENNPRFAQTVETLWQNMLLRQDQLFTSTLTIGEVLVKPAAKGDHALCRQYEKTLQEAATILTFDLQAARRYSAIRSTTSIKGPDAIQLACAGQAGVDLFVTNDRRLQGKQVEGIQFIVSLEQVPI